MSESSAVGSCVDHASSDDVVAAKLRELTEQGRLRVRSQGKTFWILQKSWQNVLFYYAPSKDGKRPSAQYVMMKSDQLWNWLAHLEWVK